MDEETKDSLLAYGQTTCGPKGLPVCKLDESTTFSNWYFNRYYFSMLRKELLKIFISNIWIKPSNEYLYTHPPKPRQRERKKKRKERTREN